MIDKIHIRALKSIKDLTVQCSNFNLFVGTNSSGKSTFLQALLLMAQNGDEEVGLNGKLASIGDFREARNYYMPNQSIKIEIWRDEKVKPAWIEFIEDKEKETYETITSNREFLNSIDFPDILDPSNYDKEQTSYLSGEYDFHYLSCHRIGVNDIYVKNMFNEYDFGVDGEYAFAYLLKNEGDPIDNSIVVQDENITNSLLEQVNYWMDYIVGTTLHISDLKKPIIYR